MAFARLTEGRLAARGTAARLEYRRSGGRLVATRAAALLLPESGTGLAALGGLRLSAPTVQGEVPARRGSATGGVHLAADRGDVASGRSLAWDGAAGLFRSDEPVDASGPGYRVHGNGLVARDDGSSIDFVHGATGRLEPGARR